MPFIKKLTLYYNTIKHLRWEQVFYRLKYKVFPVKTLPDIKVVPSINVVSYDSLCWQKKSWDAEGSPTFLQLTKKINIYKSWNVSAEPLWLYNLHYFDDLNAQDCGGRFEFHNDLISSWIKVNDDVTQIGWNPYPISLRIVNWAKFFWRNANDLSPAWLESFQKQAEVLVKRREFHILANHLFANGKALVFAGVLLNGSKGEYFLEKGLKILDAEIEEQFLEDGAHFELSPMYHSLLLFDLMELIELANESLKAELLIRQERWKLVAEKGLHWFYLMLHQDKGISFFNDASLGISPEHNDIVNMAKKLGLVAQAHNNAIFNLEQDGVSVSDCLNSGYVIAESENMKCIMDLADLGPDYQPGHGHADTLSFELDLFGKRIFVNSGTSEYGKSTKRQNQRSTFSHNTLVIDGRNSSEVWDGFRVAKRACVTSRSSKVVGEKINVSGIHDGFSSLLSNKLHKREWEFDNNSVSIIDTVNNAKGSTVKAYFYVEPECLINVIGSHVLQIINGTVAVNIAFDNIDEIMVENSNYYKEFGIELANKCIVINKKLSCNNSKLVTSISYNSEKDNTAL